MDPVSSRPTLYNKRFSARRNKQEKATQGADVVINILKHLEIEWWVNGIHHIVKTGSSSV